MTVPEVGRPVSTRTATTVGVALGVAVLGLYVLAGLLLADWRFGEFVAQLSVEVVGWLVLATALTVSVFAIPVAAYLRFQLLAPIGVLVLVILAWLGIGVASGVLSVQTVFGLAVYAAYLSPLYLALYAILGTAEHRLRRRRAA